MKKVITLVTIIVISIFLSSCSSIPQQKNIEKITINISTLSNNLEPFIEIYEQQNPNIKINVKTYQIPDGFSYEKYLKTVTTEVMSKNQSDIYSIQGLPYYKYIDKGVLKNLDEFIKNDANINNENYFMNIIDGCKYKDSYYAIPIAYQFKVIGFDKTATSEIADKPKTEKITYDEFIRYLGHIYLQNSAKPILPDSVPAPFYQMLLSNYYDNFINTEESTASFNSDDFKKLLASSKVINDQYIDNEITDILIYKYLDSNNLAAIPRSITRLDSLYSLKGIFKNNIEFMNFPVYKEGDECKYLPSEIYGISSTSEDPEAAWDFLNFLISEEIQMDNGGLPINRKAFNHMLEKNQKDGLMLSTDVVKEPIKITPFTEAELTTVLNMINNLKVNDIFANGISYLVYEEALDFYNGQRSIEEVTNSIQERIEIYLGE